MEFLEALTSRAGFQLVSTRRTLHSPFCNQLANGFLQAVLTELSAILVVLLSLGNKIIKTIDC